MSELNRYTIKWNLLRSFVHSLSVRHMFQSSDPRVFKARRTAENDDPLTHLFSPAPPVETPIGRKILV